MIAQLPPMGWNSWNTFEKNISEELIMQIIDTIIKEGYADAGYEYLVIDDCWALKVRDSEGNLVPDPEKFPHGMKAVADYVHKKGLKFGIYSCAGILTCAGYPSSYDHEYQDARQFASWGVDYLKYDFCNFPKNADCKNRYLMMSMALKASGREILLAACNWGYDDSWNWMRSIGAHTYRSTGDIFDNYQSFIRIFLTQMEHLSQSAPFCFNDLDMLTVGMYNKGYAAIGKPCTDGEYRMQFSLWCLAGSPLILGADLRNISFDMKDLLLNPMLIAIDQDPECRPPYLIARRSAVTSETDLENGTEPVKCVKNQLYTFLKVLSKNQFVVAYYNLFDEEQEMLFTFADAGIPYSSGYGFEMIDVFSGKSIGISWDYHRVRVPAHDCRLYLCRMISRSESR